MELIGVICDCPCVNSKYFSPLIREIGRDLFLLFLERCKPETPNKSLLKMYIGGVVLGCEYFFDKIDRLPKLPLYYKIVCDEVKKDKCRLDLYDVLMCVRDSIHKLRSKSNECYNLNNSGGEKCNKAEKYKPVEVLMDDRSIGVVDHTSNSIGSHLCSQSGLLDKSGCDDVEKLPNSLNHTYIHTFLKKLSERIKKREKV
jgi:hypothetical protein